jgi:hypothetical protein
MEDVEPSVGETTTPLLSVEVYSRRFSILFFPTVSCNLDSSHEVGKAVERKEGLGCLARLPSSPLWALRRCRSWARVISLTSARLTLAAAYANE